VSHILLHSLVFPPDSVSTARLLGDLVQGLQRHGHTVEVLTAAPHYRPDPELSAAQPLRRVLGGLLYRSDFGDTPVWHVAIGPKRRRLLLRLLAFAVFHVACTFVALRLARRADVLMVVSPPPTLGLVGALTAALRRIPMLYHLQELYPDFLIHQSYLRSPLLIRIGRYVERLIYRRSSRVVVLGEHFRQRLLALGVPAERIAVIPNFCLDHKCPSRSVLENAPFCVYYGGNIGLSQDWELLLDVASRVRHESIEFIISGDGARLPWLKEQVRQRGLGSVKVLGARPLQEVGGLFTACDLVVIPMRPRTCLDTFPSKVYSAFAAARPVLAAADAESDFAAAIRDAGAGVVVAPSDVDGFVSELRALMSDRQRLLTMAERSASAASHNTLAICVARFDALFADLLGGAQSCGAERLRPGGLPIDSTTRTGMV
jgi:colanic acid biosynthesis glycosyl transferase WcaI